MAKNQSKIASTPAPDSPLIRVNLDDLIPWQGNYNQGDIGAIAISIRQFGFNNVPRIWRGLNLRAGNHTTLALRLIKREGARPEWDRQFPPHNVHVDGERWYIDCMDIGDLSELEATAFAIADNRDAARASQDEALLLEYLTAISAESTQLLAGTGYDDADMNYLLQQYEYNELANTPKSGSEDIKAKRDKSVDLIFTLSPFSSTVQMLCCLAIKSGWLYGFQSGSPSRMRYPCFSVGHVEKHDICFIDNSYTEYDHALHLETVQKWKPKYATVRDVMSREQCTEAGIDYYPLEQILDWAAELSQYAENVIVIPKYDCMDQIPGQYMLGYSIPTTHGGTPLPTELFKGRRVHLLGGSFNRQLQYYHLLAEEVVSLDNNYVQKTAQYGQVWMPDGTNRSLTQLGIMDVTNPLYCALALSLGHFAAAMHPYETQPIDPLEEHTHDLESAETEDR